MAGDVGILPQLTRISHGHNSVREQVDANALRGVGEVYGHGSSPVIRLVGSLAMYFVSGDGF
jgi:hypothetical protein